MTCWRWGGIIEEKSYNFRRPNMRQYIFYLIMLLFSQPIWASNEKVINELNNAYDVSRLEFSLFKIKTELVEELRDNYKIKSFNDLYSEAGPADYKVDTWLNDQGIIIFLKLNEFLICYDKKFRFTEESMAKFSRLKTDRVAMELMQFFAHFGKYQAKNVYGDNMVDLRVAELFLFRPGDDRLLTEGQDELASKISELIKFYISVEYCPKSESTEVSRFTRIYTLTSDFEFTAVDGKFFENVEERNF